ncbi:NF-kappa-B inhibitor delta isoform X1 [Canis lupus dingo]|uniref:NF-kappa-B inhibitor delta isoform X1 n=1 Tax=Canis lupus dingo TaxID=286419 RepID=UPI000DC693B1|nr:NF-kappa-B inhibitor delta isoform X1 [Canis lupus dingo]
MGKTEAQRSRVTWCRRGTQPLCLALCVHLYVRKREFSADWVCPPHVSFRTPWIPGFMQNLPCHRQDPGEVLDFLQDPHRCLLWPPDHPWTQPVLTCWLWGLNSCWPRMRRETREYRGLRSACFWLSRAAVLTACPLPVLRLLHLFAARGLRWAAYAAAEMLQVYRRLDIREHKGKTPLLVAAAANQPLIVEDLLNLGAEPNATDHQGRSVLHVAATYGLPGVLSAVINSGVQVDLEARDFEGLTPLHTAILALNVAVHPPDLCFRVLSTQARDRLACVQMLLHMGADHTSQEIKSNKTVLHLAVQAANPTLVQLLLELPQGDLRAFVNMKAHGNTALHMAAALPPGPPQEAIVRRLLAAGADPTLRNLENEQPVHLLRPGPGPEGLRQLLKRSRVAPPGLSS